MDNLGDGLTGEDRFIQVYREEVMRTVIDGRYSGMRNIYEICKKFVLYWFAFFSMAYHQSGIEQSFWKIT